MWSPRGHSTPDACPGTLRLHAAADGGLARVRVPGGRLRTDQLVALATASGDLGDGSLELTSRGNLQVRGLAGEDAGRELAARLHAVGLLPSATHERVRNVVATSLSGRDGAGHCDIRPLVARLDRELCADPVLAELPGRFLFTVDDGRGDVTGLAGDVGLLAVRPDAIAVLLAGVDSGLRVPPAEGPRAALLAARAFLEERAASGSPAWRVAELDDPVRRLGARVRAALGSPTAEESPARTASAAHTAFPAGGAAMVGGASAGDAPAGRGARPGSARPPVGLIAQLGGLFAISVVVPLGRLDGRQAAALAEAARSGGDEINITPWRTVVIPDLTGDDAAGYVSALASAGLVCDAGSPWVGVTSCAGRPGCAKSLADVRADAGTLPGSGASAGSGAPPGSGAVTGSGAVADSGRAELPVHWAGCARRCGRPAGRHVEVLATTEGYEVRVDERLRSRSAELRETAAAITAARGAE